MFNVARHERRAPGPSTATTIATILLGPAACRQEGRPDGGSNADQGPVVVAPDDSRVHSWSVNDDRLQSRHQNPGLRRRSGARKLTKDKHA